MKTKKWTVFLEHELWVLFGITAKIKLPTMKNNSHSLIEQSEKYYVIISLSKKDTENNYVVITEILHTSTADWLGLNFLSLTQTNVQCATANTKPHQAHNREVLPPF